MTHDQKFFTIAGGLLLAVALAVFFNGGGWIGLIVLAFVVVLLLGFAG